MRGLLLLAVAAAALPSSAVAFKMKASSQLGTQHFLTAFHSYMLTHQRTYAGAEMQMRMELFRKRLREVEAHNQRTDRLWTMGMNHFSDRTEAELAQLTGWRPVAVPATAKAASGSSTAKRSAEHSQFPKEFLNWTKLESSSHVVRQGDCGSCWAFASAGVLRAHSEIHRKHSRRSFSTQELLACVPNQMHCGGIGGCGGGTVELAFDWIDKHGVNIAEFAPYTGLLGWSGVCLAPSTPLMLSRSQTKEEMERLFTPGMHEMRKLSPARGFGMVGWERLPVNSYAPLLRAVMEHGPVAVSVDANGWHHYQGGVFDGCNKDAILSHAAVLYGWGVDADSKVKYWQFQNTWGITWGEAGHIRVRMVDDEERHCGMDTAPQEGVGCDGALLGCPPTLQHSPACMPTAIVA